MHKPVEKSKDFSFFFSKKIIAEKDRKISDSDSKQEMKIFTKFRAGRALRLAKSRLRRLHPKGTSSLCSGAPCMAPAGAQVTLFA